MSLAVRKIGFKDCFLYKNKFSEGRGAGSISLSSSSSQGPGGK